MNKAFALLLALFSFAVFNTAALSAGDDTGKTQVKGYTKKNGTVVKGYTRSSKSTKAPETTEVKGYTKKNGTAVKGYTRKKSSKGTASNSK